MCSVTSAPFAFSDTTVPSRRCLGAVSADCLRGKNKGFLNGFTGGTVVLHHYVEELAKAVRI